MKYPDADRKNRFVITNYPDQKNHWCGTPIEKCCPASRDENIMDIPDLLSANVNAFISRIMCIMPFSYTE